MVFLFLKLDWSIYYWNNHPSVRKTALFIFPLCKCCIDTGHLDISCKYPVWASRDKEAVDSHLVILAKEFSPFSEINGWENLQNGPQNLTYFNR